MKKGLLVLLTLMLGTAAAVAEDPSANIGLGAWGRAVYAPLVGTTDGLSQILGTSWTDVPRVGFNVHGDSAQIGFHADINVDNGSISAGDQQYIWWKPFDKVTLSVGKFWWDDLRGNAASFGSNDFLRPYDWAGEDLTFKRARTDGLNAIAATDIVENLKAFVNVQGGKTYKDTLTSIQYGAAYTLPGLGQLKAQYIGPEATADKGKERVNAAVKVSAIPGLNVDLGVYYPLDYTKADYQYGADADFSLLAATFHGLVYYQVPKVADPMLEAALGLDYQLDDGFALTSDLRYQNKARYKDRTNSASPLEVNAAFVGLTKDYGNGRVGIGMQYASSKFTVGNGWAKFDPAVVDDPKKPHFAVPLLFQYWW